MKYLSKYFNTVRVNPTGHGQTEDVDADSSTQRNDFHNRRGPNNLQRTLNKI